MLIYLKTPWIDRQTDRIGLNFLMPSFFGWKHQFFDTTIFPSRSCCNCAHGPGGRFTLRIKHYLENEDAADCVIGEKCVGLGIEFGQFH